MPSEEMSAEERLDQIIERYKLAHDVRFELRALADDQVIAKVTSHSDAFDAAAGAENVQLQVENAALEDEEGRQDLQASIEEDEARQAGL